MHQSKLATEEVEPGFQSASQKELLLPRQRYGIDFYGFHNGEILIYGGVVFKGNYAGIPS
jgi:hypothetical protein